MRNRAIRMAIAPILLLALLLASALPALAAGGEPEVGAKGAILMDQATRRVLASQNAHEKLPMASTTKVMTAMLAIETTPLDTLITVPKEAYGVEGSSMYLNQGEKLTLEDLLYGLMLSSGNDAAVTIAMHIGGSVEGFANMMNNRARSLGAMNTSFVTPNGLHDEKHYTTAYDFALICCEAMTLPAFCEIVSTQYWKTTSGDTARTVKSKNRLLWQYEGGDGIKTGFTKAAGRCLTFSASRGDRQLVGVVLNAPDMWNDAKALLDYGFAQYRYEPVVTAGDVVKRIRVEQGMKNLLEIVAKEDILIPLRAGETMLDVEVRIDCAYSVPAPVYAGNTIGRLEVYLDGRMLASTPLISRETIYKKEYPYYLKKLIEDWVA